ncbi:hypothetical protein FHS07_001449 [Microbacterium proteolyticum]|uniref:Uncharacterized protein n=1 Tax=Microbacterium proteolyticum TaxID=1572644 RepID=A0A7W5GFF3_9MICO|nr:hypothetical protein [Microbacterium proteolyticum]MBB3157765.1 hypothetical protein [Microbacterium proteolyticum]
MAYFIALGILSLAGVIGTVWLVRTDGYGRIPTDPSRVVSSSPRTTRHREGAVHAAPAVEAARPSMHVTLPSASTATSPLRIVGTE